MPTNSTPKATSRKAHDHTRPKKPYPEFPLYAHPLGYWSRKIRGKIYHFGRWGRVVKGVLTPLPFEEGWTAALAVHKAKIDDLQAGHVPAPTQERKQTTVRVLCEKFLAAKIARRANNEIGERMLVEYRDTTNRLTKKFGPRLADALTPEDFESLRAELAKQFGPVRLSNEIVKVKSVFKYAADSDLLSHPVRFGPEFRKPSNAVLRKHKNDSGGNMMEADEIRAMIEVASPTDRAMVLLMVNCGFQAMDCCKLPFRKVDLERGWHDFPRAKNGNARRCPLWPETCDALRQAIAARPKPADEGAAELVFLTPRGRPYLSAKESANLLSQRLIGVMRRAAVHRQGRGANTLRHVFRTVADGSLDHVAIDLVMGHVDGSVAARYRERVDDARLVAVSEHVRRWLFGGDPGTGQKGKADAKPTLPNAQRDNATTGAERPTLRLFSPEVEGGAA